MPRDTALDFVRLTERQLVEEIADEVRRHNRTMREDVLRSDVCDAVRITMNYLSAPQPPASPSQEGGMREALERLGEHKNWSVQYVSKVYADDDKPDADHWAVFVESGSINDREWTEIGTGATPREALDAALAHDGGKGEG